MAATLIWSEAALADLEGIAAFIASDSPHFAAVTVDEIFEAAERVREFPGLGRMVPEYQNPQLREILYHDYRVVYAIESDRIAVVAVVHGARELKDRLGPPKE